MLLNCENAAQAFTRAYEIVSKKGENNEDTRRLTGVLFKIQNPLDFGAETWPAWRSWSSAYVETEWAWYQEATRDPSMVEEIASIWTKMKDKKGEVNSNYGWQVKRKNQWRKCCSSIVDSILTGKGTRKNVVSIYDGKEKSRYKYDTPCTISFTFVLKQKSDKSFALDLHTHMRSNDVWFGLCNDLPAFAMFLAKMTEEVSHELSDRFEGQSTDFRVKTGHLIHYVDDLHIYNNFLGRKK